eukprot:TRINITY_DN12762_c1_g1_i1.p1 TRINITY_DN12762_c1_g1~~TRINITY_DN12762_c1_g1_i1.p1  ORF type:complete len:62 (+),score=7.18 TRINITY_DN12762_c1_g1_i1:340-525(+)
MPYPRDFKRHTSAAISAAIDVWRNTNTSQFIIHRASEQKLQSLVSLQLTPNNEVLRWRQWV